MRGITAAAAHLPHWRLDRTAITGFLGTGGGKGTRRVASFDEDPVTLAVAAARPVLAEGASPDMVWFATTAPVYLEKTNATIAHAALRLDPGCVAADAAAGLRGAAAALRSALRSTEPAVLVAAGDVRVGAAGGADESAGGDAGSAILVGDGAGHPVLAECLGIGGATREFHDRWRLPGEVRTRQWEERFGEQRLTELGRAAWAAALKDAGLEAGEVARVAISSVSPRAAAAVGKALGGPVVVDDLARTVGFTGAAHPGLLLAGLLESATPGEVVALVSLADGADVFLFRATDAVRGTGRPVAEQVAAAADLPYAKYLSWRGVLPVQPPNRPEPARMSASAAERRLDWKYGFVGSRDRTSEALHLPPARVSRVGGAVDEMDAAPMADALGTVATFTIDRLAYSPSPPVVFAVVDFDGGGRAPLELTDCRPEDIGLGTRVEMTFRRLNTADGIANYFWKARPVAAPAAEAEGV